MRIAATIVIITLFIVSLFVLVIFCYSASYPYAYSLINPLDTEIKDSQILIENGFKREPTVQNLGDLWSRKEIIGKWYIFCTYDKGKLFSVSANYQVPWNDSLRGRSKDSL
jgi:hypothetical protein